ncbi:F-box/kelch-repeat protein At3g23880 [Medicago truncatula]|uniref:F-box/kelch-repeat protein At3g23880 n=1 Tax=Medicago truncatula TaxID=3880 RepID=UPI000D2F3BFA|nr:F-box/kelch-repeat protein At3g23880 [Medicago truncatula]
MPSYPILSLSSCTFNDLRETLTSHLHASRRTRPTEHSSVVPISLSRLLESPSNSITLTEDPYYNLKDKDCPSVIGSCNGLICLFGYSYNYIRESWLRFWNPATRTISDKLGHCHNPVLPYRLTFGYDNSMDTYKVVALEPEARVFSFRDNVWKTIQRFPLYHRLNWSVHLSGNVNWLATLRNYHRYDCKNIPFEQYVIISLYLSKQTYKELLLPQDLQSQLQRHQCY